MKASHQKQSYPLRPPRYLEFVAQTNGGGINLSVVADAGISFQPSGRHDGGSALGKIVIDTGDDLIIAGMFAFLTAFDKVETMGIADARDCITEAVGSSGGNFGRTVFGFVGIFRQIQLSRQGEIQAAFPIAARQAVYLMVFQWIGITRSAEQEQKESIMPLIGVFRIFKGIISEKAAIFVIQTGIIHIRPRLADNSRNWFHLITFQRESSRRIGGLAVLTRNKLNAAAETGKSGGIVTHGNRHTVVAFENTQLRSHIIIAVPRINGFAGIVKRIRNATGERRAEFACQADKGFPVTPTGRAAMRQRIRLARAAKQPSARRPNPHPLKADKRAEITDFRPDAAFALVTVLPV